MKRLFGKKKERKQKKDEESEEGNYEVLGATRQPSGLYQPISFTTDTSKIVVAAIDFGTTYSGYAFSFKHDYNTDRLKIYTNNWSGNGIGPMNAKTPTYLLLDPEKKLHSFGDEAKLKYESLLLDEENENWYFLKEFKMTLHREKEITENYMIRAENGKTIDALTVFRCAILALKNHFMQAVKNGFPGVYESDVKWVITVPAIWNDSAKKFIRLAAEKAGIKDIEIALEPEAASIFCRQLPMTRDTQLETGMTKFPVGTQFMTLDCGGGTVDVTVLEVLENNNLKELHRATGGNWGGTVVNKSFMNFISKLVGYEAFKEFSKSHQLDYQELLDEFERKKRIAAVNLAEKIAVKIPTTLQRLINDNRHPLDEEADESEYRNKVKLVNDKLRIESALFESFFTQAVSDIKFHVEGLMKKLPRPVQAILMVGGFSDSPILQRAIRDTFKTNVEVIVPAEASLCVMKGAVLYGRQPSKIIERKSRYTYGVAMTVPFNNVLHPKHRKIIGDGREWCDKVFDKHVEIGQSIKMNEALPVKEYFPMSSTDSFLPVYVFRSTEKDPKFVDEESCECVGEFRVKRGKSIGETSRTDNVHVQLRFGGSDIKVEVVKCNSCVESTEFILKG